VGGPRYRQPPPDGDCGGRLLEAQANDHGQYDLDFHCLRVTFITNLALGGVHPKVARTLARHSTITLTMDHYTKLSVLDHASAPDTLPALDGGPHAERETLEATGTDGQPVEGDGVTGRSWYTSEGRNRPNVAGIDRNDGEPTNSRKWLGGHRKCREHTISAMEAAAGFEPAIADLQSAALVHLAMPPHPLY